MVDKKDNDTPDRAKSINSVYSKAAEIDRQTKKQMQNTQKTINSMMEQARNSKATIDKIAASEPMEKMTPHMSKVLQSMGTAMHKFSAGIVKITAETAKASGDAVRQYGKAISEDISVNKQNVVAMSLAHASPIFGYFASKFLETDIWRSASTRMKQSISSALSDVGSSLSNVMKSGVNRVKSAFAKKEKIESDYKTKELNNVISKVKKDSEKDKLAAARERAAHARAVKAQQTEKLKQSKTESTERLKEIQKTERVKQEKLKTEKELTKQKTIQQSKIIKDGKLIYHVDKIYLYPKSLQIEGATPGVRTGISGVQQPTGTSFYTPGMSPDSAFYGQTSSLRGTDAKHSDIIKDKVKEEMDMRGGVLSTFFSEWRLLSGRKTIEERMLKQLIDIRMSMRKLNIGWDRVKTAWQRTLVEHPLFRNIIGGFQSIYRILLKKPLSFMFRIRGGYIGPLRKAMASSNAFDRIANVLGLIYGGAMPKLDQLISDQKQLVEYQTGVKTKAVKRKEYRLLPKILGLETDVKDVWGGIKKLFGYGPGVEIPITEKRQYRDIELSKAIAQQMQGKDAILTKEIIEWKNLWIERQQELKTRIEKVQVERTTEISDSMLYLMEGQQDLKIRFDKIRQERKTETRQLVYAVSKIASDPSKYYQEDEDKFSPFNISDTKLLGPPREEFKGKGSFSSGIPFTKKTRKPSSKILLLGTGNQQEYDTRSKIDQIKSVKEIQDVIEKAQTRRERQKLKFEEKIAKKKEELAIARIKKTEKQRQKLEKMKFKFKSKEDLLISKLDYLRALPILKEDIKRARLEDKLEAKRTKAERKQEKKDAKRRIKELKRDLRKHRIHQLKELFNIRKHASNTVGKLRELGNRGKGWFKSIGTIFLGIYGFLVRRIPAFFRSALNSLRAIWIAVKASKIGGAIGKGASKVLRSPLMKKIMPVAGRFALPVTIALGAVTAVTDLISGWKEEGLKGALKKVFIGDQEGGLKSAFRGMGKYAALGAGLGSIVPGIGTLAGGLIGAALGFVIGALGVEKMKKIGQVVGKLAKKTYSIIWKFVTFPNRIMSKGISFVKDKIVELKNKGFKGLASELIDKVKTVVRNVADVFMWPFRKISELLKNLKNYIIDEVSHWPGGKAILNLFGLKREKETPTQTTEKRVHEAAQKARKTGDRSIYEKELFRKAQIDYRAADTIEEQEKAPWYAPWAKKRLKKEYEQRVQQRRTSAKTLMQAMERKHGWTANIEDLETKTKEKPGIFSRAVSAVKGLGSKTKEKYQNLIGSFQGKEIILPTDSNVITSPFGPRDTGLTGASKYHEGIDLRARMGDDIRSILPGKVVQLNDKWGRVLIDHGNELQSSYAHLSKKLVKKGDVVSAGQLIGKSGNTGPIDNMTSHLHLSMLHNGKHIDPEQFLSGTGIALQHKGSQTEMGGFLKNYFSAKDLGRAGANETLMTAKETGKELRSSVDTLSEKMESSIKTTNQAMIYNTNIMSTTANSLSNVMSSSGGGGRSGRRGFSSGQDVAVRILSSNIQ